MNRIVVLLCVCISIYHCRLHAQPINNAIKDVVMPPPNAASLGKYGDIPVSFYTGLPDIGIPIYTITDGPLSLPVSLSYHASGLRPGELASWVGLGWSLQAGGVITRTVQGREDERGQGYFSVGTSLAVDANGCVAALPTYSYSNFSSGYADGEPDIFSFSIGGYSGKFFFEADKTNDGVLNPKIVLIPKQDVRIEYQLENNISSIANIRSFTITLPDGTRYLFGKTSVGAALDGIEATRTNPANNLMASSWYLRKVSSADGNYNITLDYTQEKYRYGFRAGFSSGYQSTPVNGYRENLNYVEGWRLATITSPTATVTFVAGSNREDIDNRDFNGNASANPAKVLQSIQIQSGTFCKKLDLTQTYYVDATARKTGNDNEDKRLKLNSVQEKSCDGLVTASPYSLQYYENALNPNYLPSRLSSGIDHWGFFNGAANSTAGLNIPATRLQYQNVLGEQIDMVKGNAKRESAEDSMKLGTLKKIGYPTGGSTTFEYEANTYYGTRQVTSYAPAPNVLDGAWPFGQCHNQIALQQIGSSIVQTFNDPSSTYFKWETIGAQTVVGDCDKNLELQIRVFNNATNTQIATLPVGVNPNDNNAQNDVPAVQTGPLTKLLPNIPAGVPIRFETWGRNVASRLSFGIYTVTNVNDNIKVGGLRVKKVTSNDGVSAGNDVVKTYTYHDPQVSPAQSSGLLYSNPIYGYVYKVCISPDSCRVLNQIASCPKDSTYIYPLFFENSVVPLGSFEGYHLGYSAVKESFNAGATGYYNLYKYSNDAAPAFTGVPVTPIQPRITSGQLAARRQRDANHADVAYELFQPKTEVAQGGLGTYAKFSTYFVYGDPAIPITVWQQYPLATFPFRHQSVQTYRDGMLVTTTREYNGTAHLQLTKESFTGSDGKVTATEYKYPADLAGLPAAQLAAFNTLNLLVPLETNVKVDNVQVKGSKTEFAFFDNASGAFVSTTSSAATNFIRPYQFKNYEGAAWVQKGQVDSYHGAGSATGRAGLPKQFTQAGWQPETYEWTTAGLIKKRTFINFNWQYEYAAGTRLVTKITGPDGQFTDYTYDKLMRLDQSKARNNNVVTTFTYAYPTLNGAGNITSFGYVKSSTAYTPVAGSGLGTQETLHYFDGLGRDIEAVYKAKATGGRDQIIATAYDPHGRVSKQFEPFAGAGSTGAYQAPGGTPFTLTEYENTPLGRSWKVTPPSWATTTTEYASNTAADFVLNFNYATGTSSTFPAGTLFKVTLTDGNGNKTITFTDKKGRQVLSRKTGSGGNEKADTYYVYDDKDRLVRVLPPGASWNDTGLVYTYQYTNNDLISQKQIPGKAYEAFEYNNRDLPVRYQDGILRANSNRWMGSKYDAYGQLTEKGVWASGSGDAVVLSNKIIEKIYGSAGIEIDKLKIDKVQAFTVADPVVTPGAANAVLQTTYNYDAFGRISGTAGNNHLSVANLNAENVTYAFDHGDNILTETRSSAHSAGTTSYVNTHLFDAWGRLTQTSQNLNGTGDKIISQLAYTDKDQLNWKKLGNGLQQMDYSYLPNGLLSAINGSAPLAASTYPVSGMLNSLATPTFSANNNGDLFREVLEYNSLTAGLGGTVQNNGNIGQVLWQVKGRAANAYGLTYDYLDRLTNAKFSSYTSGGSIDPADYYGESFTYDLRGNITTLTRKGMVKGASAYTNTITDNKTLAIQAGTNQAMQSTGTGSVSGSVDVPHNHLNLPYRFDFGGNNTIDLLYDGLGNKLRKTVKTNNVVTLTRDYLDGIELKNNTIEAVYNQEGRAYNNAGTFRYEYALRDHLGNTRVVFTDKGAAGIQDQTEILSETHYYPFGKMLEGAWYNDATAPKYRYLYNGKELHEEFGLNFYDYGARWYDPGVGSWWEVDPMAEKREWLSPYNYAQNNPLIRVDPTGALDEPWYKRVWNTVQSVAASASFTLVKSEQVRNDYKDKVSKLDPTDSKGRTQIKMDAREKTPAVMKAVAEEMRPASKEASRVAGTASKTNAGVNSVVEGLGKVGKVAGGLAVGISVYNVATSDNIPKAATHEVGTLGGAIAGGEGGAVVGAAIGVWFAGAGAVPGAIIGGIVGSIAGGISGGILADKVYEKTTKQD